MCSCRGPAKTPACTRWSAPNPRAPASWTSQTLAIDTPNSPNLQQLSTAELRAERDRLRQQLDQAPRDRRRELARATTHRQHAEEALAAHQQPAVRQPPGMLRWLLRSNDQPAQLPGALAVATQQA